VVRGVPRVIMFSAVPFAEFWKRGSSVRMIPSGVNSESQERSELDKEPYNYSVGDCCPVNITPLQLRGDVLWVHSACLDGVLVTAAI
jgi:hypothetical protein